MSDIFEILMIVLFGISWPLNIIKSLKAKTTKGKSLLFLFFIFTGYIFGISSKLISNQYKLYVLIFYFINLFMVGFDIILYFRNLKLDKARSLNNIDK